MFFKNVRFFIEAGTFDIKCSFLVRPVALDPPNRPP